MLTSSEFSPLPRTQICAPGDSYDGHVDLPSECSKESVSTDTVARTIGAFRTVVQVRELTEESMHSFAVQGAETFVLRELLGEGGFGSVYRCTLQQSVKQGSTFVVHVDRDRPGLLCEFADILKRKDLDVRDAQINVLPDNGDGRERAMHTYTVVENTTGRKLSFERLVDVQETLSKIEFVRCMIKEGAMELDGGDAAALHASRSLDRTPDHEFIVTVRNDNASDQFFTSVTVEGPDVNGLVASITATLDAASVSILKFHGGHVDDSPGCVRDTFHVTRDGKQVPQNETENLADQLRAAVAALTTDSTNAATGGQDFAVKVVNARRLALISGHSLDVVCPIVQREMEVLNHLGTHPRLVKLHYAYHSKESSRFYLVSELILGGDLFNAIVRRGKPFSESDARTLLTQLVEAIAFCHSRQVAHRDLKLENCLLEAPDSLCVKVCDYGQSKFFGFQDQAKTLTTTPAYTAPEVAQAVKDALPYDAYKADVFSLGVILYCLLCNALPVDAGKRLYEQHRAWLGLSPSVKNLIGKLLVANVDLRPQAEDVLHDEWVSKHTQTRESSPAVASNSSSSPASLTPTTSPLLDRQHAKCVLETLVCVQLAVDALQRERVSAVIASAHDEMQFYWQMRATDEHFVKADQHVVLACKKFESDGTNTWRDLQFELRQCASHVAGLRATAYKIIKSPQGQSNQEAADAQLMCVFVAYHPILSRLISAMISVFSLGSAASNPPRIATRLRILALTSEQLARERGFIAAYFKDPHKLRSIPAVLSLAEIIGARKLLVGVSEGATGSQDSSVNYEPHVVASSSGGLLCALLIGESSPLEAEDLLALESFEKKLFATHDALVGQGAVSEWWHLLLGLADKFHRLMVMGLMELFANDRSWD